MPRRTYKPQLLLSQHLDRVADVPSADFFNRPEYQFERDIWLAAQFGLAYEQLFKECRIAIDIENDQTSSDFDFVVDEVSHPFQSTEIQSLGRRRGEEYREKKTSDSPPDTADDWGPGTEHAHTWLNKGLAKKVEKHYSNAGELNILLYANIHAFQMPYDKILNACQENSAGFQSVWAISPPMLCIVKPSPGLGSFLGWKGFAES